MTFRGFRIPLDVPLVASVFCLVLYYSVVVRFVAIERILRPMRERSRKPGAVEVHEAAQSQLLDKAWRASNFFLGRCLRRRDFCLPRTLALYRWCSSRTIDVGLVIGVRKEGNALQGHAWLLVSGAPYRENVADLDRYAQMVRL